MRRKLKPYPKFGDKRIIKRFLWFPKVLWLESSSDRELRWFEEVEIEQIRVNDVYGTMWMSLCWNEKS